MNFKIDVPNAPALAVKLLTHAGFEAGVVGGCNRDAIMGKTPDDWDICTSATPDEIQMVFKGYKQLTMGLKHGTVTIIIDNEPIEITTYRIDGEYSDGRRPDRVAFTRNLIEDLSRRDYTQNAIFYNEFVGIVDPFNGLYDIEHKIIRCVGDANKRLQEDALRILRGIRFAAKLDFNVEAATKQAMFDNKALLKNVSQERITVEFIKLLQGKAATRILDEFSEIITYIIPELKPMIGFYDDNMSIDLWQHSLAAFDNASDFIIKLTLLFHDIGKPKYCSSVASQNEDFQNSAELSAQITSEIFKTMRLTNAEGIDKNILKEVVELIKYHNFPITATTIGVKKMLSKLSGNIVQFRRLLLVKKAHLLAKGSDETGLNQLAVLEALLDQVLEQNPCTTLKDLAISGKDLTSIGLPKGERIGELLNKLLEDVITEKVENNKNALIKQVQTYQ